MAASEQIARLTPYARRLLDDEYLQNEIGQLITSLRDGSRRALRKGPAQAATDRKLRGQLSAAVAAATHIGRALQEPEPPPERHRLRQVVLVTAAAAAATVGYRQLTADGTVAGDD